MTDLLTPQTEDELAEIIRKAAHDKEALAVTGTNSKDYLGYPSSASSRLSLTAFDSLHDYTPSELAIIAGTGMTRNALEKELQKSNQYLAFEPPDYGPLLGKSAGQGTLGGIIGTGLSGSRRISCGAVRDFVHGYRGVSGKGEIHKAGGPVFKTVTGYDVPRLMVGSMGTLACLYEVAFKVLPKPQLGITLVFTVSDDWEGVRLMSSALGTPYEVSGAALLPPMTPQQSLPDAGLSMDETLVALRLEGFAISVEAREKALIGTLGLPLTSRLDSGASDRFWRWLNQAGPLLSSTDNRLIWRLSCPPADGAHVGSALKALGADLYYDWGGGLIHVSVPMEVTAEEVRATFSAFGGHATLLRAPEEIRLSIPPFQPLLPAEKIISERIRLSFDPQSILNPDRMYRQD